MHHTFLPAPKERFGQIKERTMHDSVVVVRGTLHAGAEI